MQSREQSELRLRRVAEGRDLLGPGYSALWVRAGASAAGERTESVRSTLEPLLRHRPFEIHELACGDIIALVRGFAVRELSGLVEALKAAYAPPEGRIACTIYDLTCDLGGFAATLGGAFGQTCAPPEAQAQSAKAADLWVDTPKGALKLSKLWQRAAIAS